MTLPKIHPFLITRKGYATPAQGWFCLIEPFELAGLIGEYGYSPELYAAQEAVKKTQQRQDTIAMGEATQAIAQLYARLSGLISKHMPTDPVREQQRVLLYPKQARPNTVVYRAA